MHIDSKLTPVTGTGRRWVGKCASRCGTVTNPRPVSSVGPKTCFQCGSQDLFPVWVPRPVSSVGPKTCFQCGSQDLFPVWVPRPVSSVGPKTCFQCGSQDLFPVWVPRPVSSVGPKTCFQCGSQDHERKDCTQQRTYAQAVEEDIPPQKSTPPPPPTQTNLHRLSRVAKSAPLKRRRKKKRKKVKKYEFTATPDTKRKTVSSSEESLFSARHSLPV